MPRSVRWKGMSIYRPGAYTFNNLSGLTNLDLGASASIIIVGEADAGEPQASSANPVYHVFTDPQQMIDTFQSGNLAEVARFAFKPLLDGQDEDGVPLKGCDTVYVIKTNQSTQASATVEDGSANDAFTLKDLIWGLKGNQTWFKIETSGTGIKLTIGRENEPNVGDQVSSDFGITGTDEWITGISTTAQFTGTSCTVAFDGTTLTFDSDVAAEDLAITCTNKTVQEIMQEMVAFNPHGTGSVYEYTSIRSDRTPIAATYMDEFTAQNCYDTNSYSPMGVSYDMVAWINTNSVYCSATWVGGFEPQTYTLTYLTGGTQGDSTETTIQEALKTAKKLNCRFLASAYNGAVGSGGSIALATVNGHLETHLNQCNPIGGRCERQGFGCVGSTTKANLYTELEARNNEWVAYCGDQVYREGPDGTIQWLGAHCVAVAAASAHAGSPIATPITHKYIQAYDYKPVATDFDPDENLDFENGIKKGLLFLENDPGVGIRFAKGISSYKTEDNDGRIYLEVVESRLWMHRTLRRNLERPFTGHKGRGVRTVNQVKGRVLDVFRALADPNSPDFILIEGTDSQGNTVPPYRNVQVRLSGDQVYVSAEVTYTMGINWIFTELRATLPTALAA